MIIYSICQLYEIKNIQKSKSIYTKYNVKIGNLFE
jgi:hypothetical protein